MLLHLQLQVMSIQCKAAVNAHHAIYFTAIGQRYLPRFAGTHKAEVTVETYQRCTRSGGPPQEAMAVMEQCMS